MQSLGQLGQDDSQGFRIAGVDADPAVTANRRCHRALICLSEGIGIRMYECHNRTMAPARRVTLNRLTASAFALLAPAEAAKWARRLERTARPCGCKSGAVLIFAALLGWPA